MTANILAIGLNHSTAPVEVREKVVFPGDAEGAVTRSLLELDGVREAMILSTCNRSELIATAENPDIAVEALIEAMASVHGLNSDSLREFLYIKRGEDAVRHVFRVASSLDSMVLGEPQILGQVKDGYSRAAGVQATGPVLNRLLHRAFFTAKRVRTETGIGYAAVSVAYVAVELAKKILGELRGKSVVLIGAGEMAELAARHLAGQVAGKPILVFNRTYQNACGLAQQLQGHAFRMEQLEQGLAAADVVITSTGSCDPLITAAQMKQVMRLRRFRPIFLIDIALPRDVQPEVNDIDGVYLYNIDDLQAVVEENIGERRQEAEHGESIVEEEVAKFMKWAGSLHATPTIVALKDKLESIRVSELERLDGRLSNLNPSEREIVDLITKSIINKIAHHPISFLKRTGLTQRSEMYLDVVQRIFKLNGAVGDQAPEKDEPPSDTNAFSKK